MRRGTPSPIVAPRVRGCLRQQRLSSTKLQPTTSSSFIEEPTPRTHRQCRRRSPPTGWSSRDLIPKGPPPPPLDTVTGNRTRGPSPPRTTPTTPAAAAPEAVTVASNAGPICRSRTCESQPPLTRRRHGGRRREGEPSPRPPAGEDAEQILSRSVESGRSMETCRAGRGFARLVGEAVRGHRG